MATILVLEDDADLLNLYTRALKFRGYEVAHASSAEQAIALLEADGCVPDAAVLDMSMPGLPGTAVVDYIRKLSRCPTLPIIVVSCNETFRSQLQDPSIVFMTKPIALADLYNAIARCIAPPPAPPAESPGAAQS